MRTYSLFLLGTMALLRASAHAQVRPEFSGEWVRVDSTAEQRSVAAVGDAAFRVGNMGSGWGSPLTLRLDADRLIVEYTHFGTYDLQPKVRFVYALDGSESRNTVMIGHAASVLQSRTVLRDNTLVVTTMYPGPGPRDGSVLRQTLTLESPTSLVIESRYAGTTPNAWVITRTRYTKR